MPQSDIAVESRLGTQGPGQPAVPDPVVRAMHDGVAGLTRSLLISDQPEHPSFGETK